MEWKKVEGYQQTRPKEVDTESSPSTVYLRRSIVAVEDENGTHWSYEEAAMTREEFKTVSQVIALEKQQEMDKTLAAILLKQLGI